MRRLGEEAERLNADFYVADLKEAGFEIRVAVPISELAEAHLTKNYNQKVESGKEASPWLSDRITSIKTGHKFGLKITAVKPASS